MEPVDCSHRIMTAWSGRRKIIQSYPLTLRPAAAVLPAADSLMVAPSASVCVAKAMSPKFAAGAAMTAVMPLLLLGVPAGLLLGAGVGVGVGVGLAPVVATVTVLDATPV